MAWAKVVDGAVSSYPYSIEELRRDNPNVSFPHNMGEDALLEWGVYEVSETPPPPYDPLTQDVVPRSPEFQDGALVRSWDVLEASPEEAQRRRADVHEQVKAARVADYRDEADPLFFKAQRGEASMEEWTAKVAEIKARYPYPTGA